MKTTKFSFAYNGTSCHGEGDFFTEEDLPILNNYYFQWKDINEINLTYNVRRANIPELLTEGICSALWGWARTNAKQIKGLSSSSCDLIDIKAGKTIQVKACSSLREDDKVGPSSFGPDSHWDCLIFIHIDCSNDIAFFYDLSNEDYLNWKVSKKETFQEQANAGKRPRLNLLDLVKEKEYKPFYIYCFEK